MSLKLADDFTLEVTGIARVAPAATPLAKIEVPLVDVFGLGMSGELDAVISQNVQPEDAVEIVRSLSHAAGVSSPVKYGING